MLIADKKHFWMGAIMTIVFAGVLAYMFSPSFNGQNAFHASDGLFNSIAKDSTDYFPMLMEQNEQYAGHSVDVSLKLPGDMLSRASAILGKNNIQAEPVDGALHVRGDLNNIVDGALVDARAMFNNNKEELVQKYAMEGKNALYVWWNILKETEKQLKMQKDFKAAKFLSEVVKRGVEVGYNFYGVSAQSAQSRAGTLTFALVFYVAYTLWWGYAIFFLFEGFGLQMSSGEKKEV